MICMSIFGWTNLCASARVYACAHACMCYVYGHACMYVYAWMDPCLCVEKYAMLILVICSL